jgi:predicted Fe-Mo cluster-binding NifX family protein
MRVAMPIRNGRIAPVLDTARHLLLVDVAQGEERDRRETTLPPDPFLTKRPGALRNLKIDVLICGGISRLLARAVSRERLTVISWVAGSVESVLEAYLTGRLLVAPRAMPGCRVRWSGPHVLPVGERARAKKRARAEARSQS